jgi:hypothetical protein
MGSAPSETILKELEREAYAALLRVVYSRPSVDIMVSIINLATSQDVGMEVLEGRLLTSGIQNFTFYADCGRIPLASTNTAQYYQ